MSTCCVLVAGLWSEDLGEEASSRGQGATRRGRQASCRRLPLGQWVGTRQVSSRVLLGKQAAQAGRDPAQEGRCGWPLLDPRGETVSLFSRDGVPEMPEGPVCSRGTAPIGLGCSQRKTHVQAGRTPTQPQGGSCGGPGTSWPRRWESHFPCLSHGFSAVGRAALSARRSV